MAKTDKSRRWRTAVRSHPRIVSGVVIAILALLALGAGFGLGAWRSVCRDCPSVAQIYVFEPKQSTRIFDREGELLAELFQERRTPVALESLPSHVPQAFVAVEDKRFYQHEGFDVRGFARAAVNLVLQRRIRGGGSTITQQLARNMFDEEVGFAQRFERKLKELKVARELEQVYTKEQILEAYLNQILYGHGWWGIETAAQRYFGKPASELQVEEAALLAAVINLPGRYSPFVNPEIARSRRNLVIGLMAQQGFIPEEAVDSLRALPIPETRHGAEEGALAAYFVESVRDVLDDRYGASLYERGYRVHTTLDADMQRRAEAAMENGWNRIESQPGFRGPTYRETMDSGESSSGGESPYLQGMFVALDPATGDIRALVGGRDFEDSKFNRATQAHRQPGSAFKPFVYTAAVASGIPASHVLYDAPIMLDQEGREPWSPRNYDGQFHGPTTIRAGLRQSLNLVAVKLGLEVGVQTVVQYAERMGISTNIPRLPAITIGAADVIPLDLVQAYAPLATGGVRIEPRSIARVEDAEGRVLWETEPERTQVLDTLVAAVTRDMLRDVVDHGTAYPVRNPAVGNLPYEVPAAGKTGTTNDNTDVWFVGFTPDLLAGVWFGYDRPRSILPRATGGVYASPVWAEFMRSVYTGDDRLREIPAEWEMPEALTTRQIDEESGKLATDWCPIDNVYDEVFIPGSEPNESCDLHGPGLFGVPLRDSLEDSIPDSLQIRSNRRF